MCSASAIISISRMNFTIRRADRSDIPLIRRMADVIFRLTYADILSPEQMEYMMDWMYSAQSLQEQIEGPGKAFCVAEADGKPAGYVSFEFEDNLPDGRKLFHLQKLYVMPAFQRCGLGMKLYSHVKECLFQYCPEGFRIELNVNRNNPAVGFYERVGMVRDRQGDFPIGKGFYMNDYIYAEDIMPL